MPRATGLALPGYAVYAATKSGVETLTKIFAKELRGRDITVNAVAPDPTATDPILYGKTPEQTAHPSKIAPLERPRPTGRRRRRCLLPGWPRCRLS